MSTEEVLFVYNLEGHVTTEINKYKLRSDRAGTVCVVGDLTLIAKNDYSWLYIPDPRDDLLPELAFDRVK